MFVNIRYFTDIMITVIVIMMSVEHLKLKNTHLHTIQSIYTCGFFQNSFQWTTLFHFCRGVLRIWYILKFNSFKAKEQFWNDIFRTVKINQTGEKYYLAYDQDLAFFLFIWMYTYSYWCFPYMGYVFPSFTDFFEEVLKC